jgi:hypothetical protein
MKLARGLNAHPFVHHIRLPLQDSCGTGAGTAEWEGAPTVPLLFLFEVAEAKTAAAFT